MPSRVVPPSFFLPSPVTPRDRALNQALVDMYRPIQRRLDDSIQSDVLANIPASSGTNRIFWASDTQELYFDTATGWVNVTSSFSLPSQANLTIEVPDAGDVDPWLQFTITGTQNFRLGIDDSDSDAFVIANSTALGTSNFFKYVSGAFTLTGTLGVGAITSTGSVTGTSLAAGAGAITGGSLNVGSGAITGGALTGTSLGLGGGGITCGTISGSAITGTSLSAGVGTITGGATTITTLDCTTISATGDADITRSQAGGTVALAVINSSVTSGSAARVLVSVTGATAGAADPYVQWSADSQHFVAGIDNSDSNAWVLSAGAAIGSSNALRASVTGAVSVPTSTLSVTGGDFDVTRSASGINVTALVANSSNTANSHASVQARIAGTSAGDAVFSAFINGSTTWAWGLDNSASDAWVLSQSSSLGTNNCISVATGGAVSVPLGDLDVTRSSSAGTVQATISNTSNTANSNAVLNITVAGASANDAYALMSVSGVTQWAVGVDNSDSDNFKICAASALDTTNDLLSIATTGSATFKRLLSGSISTIQAAMQLGIQGGTQSAGAGASLLFYGDDSTSAKEFMGRISGVWENSANGSEAAGVQINVRANAADTNATTVGLKVLSDLQVVGGIVSGGQWSIQSNTELLSIDATPKDTTANLLPAGSIILGVTSRVTTSLTNVTTWSIGDPTTAARFSAAAGGTTAGSTRVGIDHWSGAVTTLAAGPSQAAAAKLRFTRATGSGTPSGAIRFVVYALVFTPPTS